MMLFVASKYESNSVAPGTAAACVRESWVLWGAKVRLESAGVPLLVPSAVSPAPLLVLTCPHRSGDRSWNRGPPRRAPVDPRVLLQWSFSCSGLWFSEFLIVLLMSVGWLGLGSRSHFLLSGHYCWDPWSSLLRGACTHVDTLNVSRAVLPAGLNMLICSENIL